MKTIIQLMGMDCTKFGGLERFIIAVIDQCVDCRFVLVYNSMPQSLIYREELAKRNVEIIVCNYANLDIKGKLRFAKRIISYEPNVVHWHFDISKIIAIFIKLLSLLRFRTKKCKMYHTIHLCIPSKASSLLNILRIKKLHLYYRIFSIFIDKILAVSNYCAGQMRTICSLKKVDMIYLGVDKYKAKPIDLIVNKKVITCLGFASPIKGIDVFVRGLSNVKYNDYEAWIIGLDETSDYTKQIKMLARELEVYDKIKWIGIVDNVCEYIKKSDLFCQTSRSEALSLVACEALMLGCPVIGASVGGLPEVAQLTFETENSLQLAELIDSVLIDTDYRNQLSREAIAMWKLKFQLADGAKKYMDLYLN